MFWLLVGVLLAAMPASAQDIPLEQETTLEFEYTTATLSLPAGWMVQPFGNGFYILGKDEDSILLITEGIEQVFDNIVAELEGGGDDTQPTPVPYTELVVGLIAASDKAELGMAGVPLEDFVMESFDYAGSPFPVDLIENIEVDGHPAILVPMQFSPDDIPPGTPENLRPSGLVVIADYDTFFLMFMGMAIADTNQEPLFEAVIGSIAVDDGTTQLPPVTYEDEFLDMLAIVPASMSRLEGIPQLSYVNYRAVEQARAGVPAPQSWQELMNLRDSDDDAFSLWNANSRRIMSGPTIFQYLPRLENMLEVMGFDFFAIDRSLTFGQPPETVTILGGDFNGDAIAAAHTARDYTASDVNGVSLWCGPVGCENGLDVDFTYQEVANIFGGDLGRQFPFAVLPGHLVSSGDLPAVQSAIAAYQGEQGSLLDVPAYRAAAEAVTQGDGLLVQVQFLRWADVGAIPLAGMGPDEDLITELLASYGPLPLYELAVLVDGQQGDTQVAIMLLVYNNEDDARSGAEELTARIASFARLDYGETDPILTHESINGQMGDPSVYYSEAADKWVAIATALYPTPEEDALEEASGRLFRHWVDSLYNRSLTPLVVDTGGL